MPDATMFPSPMWSYTEGCCVGMGYLNNPDGVTAAWVADGEFTVDIGGHLVGATPSIRSFCDPTMSMGDTTGS